jgi:hypothetical protein
LSGTHFLPRSGAATKKQNWLIGRTRMNGVTMWIRDGVLSSRPKKENGLEYQDKSLFDQFGMVRVFSDASGTTVQWNMGCPNWASLMLAAKLVSACAAPYAIKYFNSGWFKETLPDAASTEDRIEALMFKSDVRLSDRAFTKVIVPDLQLMPDGLRQALEKGDAPDSYSVVCSVEPEREQSHVEHVGKDSLIARIWGISPNSYPCLNGHSYDRAVTPEYFRVVETGRAHYDHVLASMVRPNGELHWLGYHRVILPDFKEGRKRVRIVSELAPVDIQLL